jgi:hypothetical protein
MLFLRCCRLLPLPAACVAGAALAILHEPDSCSAQAGAQAVLDRCYAGIAFPRFVRCREPWFSTAGDVPALRKLTKQDLSLTDSVSCRCSHPSLARRPPTCVSREPERQRRSLQRDVRREKRSCQVSDRGAEADKAGAFASAPLSSLMCWLLPLPPVVPADQPQKRAGHHSSDERGPEWQAGYCEVAAAKRSGLLRKSATLCRCGLCCS